MDGGCNKVWILVNPVTQFYCMYMAEVISDPDSMCQVELARGMEAIR